MRKLIDSVTEGMLNERAREANIIAAVMQRGNYINQNLEEVQIKTFQDFMRFINERFTVRDVGEGAFSVAKVGSKKADFVLKVSKGERVAASDSWPGFAKMAMKKHKTDSLYPKILALKEYDSEKFGFFTVGLIEFLDIDENRAARAGVSPRRMNIFKELWIQHTKGTLSKVEYETTERDVQGFFGVPFKQLGKFLVDIAPIGKQDIHDGNVGWRKNGEFVIFDPTS